MVEAVCLLTPILSLCVPAKTDEISSGSLFPVSAVDLQPGH